jgi:hypothetical protein
MRRVGLVVLAFVLVGCTSPKPSAAPKDTGPSREPAGRQTPGFTTCGSFELRATTHSAAIPLLSCAGLANTNPLPTVRMRVGEAVEIRGAENGSRLVLHGGSAVAIDGLQITARDAGSTIVTVSGWSCAELIEPPPKACPLLRITIDG